jgi:hypothetical protein
MKYGVRLYRYKSRRRQRKTRAHIYIVVTVAAAVCAFFGWQYYGSMDHYASTDINAVAAPVPFAEPVITQSGFKTVQPVDATKPSAFDFSWDVMKNGNIVGQYSRTQGIEFPSSSFYSQDAKYTDLKGVTTFRGNNYRNAPGFGAANVTEKKLEPIWNISTGTFDFWPMTGWKGAGWTGQPLIVQWDDSMRQIMNLYPDKKEKDGLTEIIYPTMDGKIYFMDLSDGTPTRDPIDMGFIVKGTASVDPRGYPLLYVGQGVGMSGDQSSDYSCIHIYSLIDGKEQYKYGFEAKDPFSLRDSWQGWDASPLVASDADALIWTGENGILYVFQLHADFDESAGTVSVSPDEPVKYRYDTPRNGDDKLSGTRPDTRWYGVEDSPLAYGNYVYFTDNGGWLQCVDLNTMQPVWVQDVTDDSDATMVLEEDGPGVYLYTGSEIDKSLERGSGAGNAYIRKINALTGEIVWEVPYLCFYEEGSNGGVIASPVLGRGNLQGMVFYTIARTGKSKDSGLMAALDKKTGEVVWEKGMDHFSWSSPIPVYTGDGTGYLVQCDCVGGMMLLDGVTGEVYSKISMDGNVEASPAVYNNIVVVGTRGQKIYGVRIN